MLPSPMSNNAPLSTWSWDDDAPPTGQAGRGQGRGGQAAFGGGGRGGRGGGRGGFGGGNTDGPRVVMRFPSDPAEMLLSGSLDGGEALAGRAQVVDAPVGNGHVVMFAIRPFWRWQTQGTFFLAFNAILNWNDLNAGRTMPPASQNGGGPPN